MATFYQMPLDSTEPWYTFKISLSGVIFTIRIRFNVRMQRWMLDFADTADNDIMNGLPLLTLRNLKGQYILSGLPAGDFFVYDETLQGAQPTRNSFGKDKLLMYSTTP